MPPAISFMMSGRAYRAINSLRGFLRKVYAFVSPYEEGGWGGFAVVTQGTVSSTNYEALHWGIFFCLDGDRTDE